MRKRFVLVVGLVLGACSPAGPGECGDALCRPAEGESCSTCAADCGSCAGCGDGSCDAALGESCVSCVADCGSCAPTCGDGTCDAAETCSSCPGDCGACTTSCSPETCAGCCQSGVCVGATSPDACGSGGGLCMACATGFTCAAGACRIEPTSRWNVVLEHLHVEPTYYTGAAWDSIGGTPDPYVQVRVGAETATPAITATANDTYEVDYDGGPTVMMARASDLQAHLAFAVHDDDSPPSFSDDFVGNCIYAGLADAAFAGFTQTVECPRDAATMNSGYTLTWHLEPF